MDSFTLTAAFLSSGSRAWGEVGVGDVVREVSARSREITIGLTPPGAAVGFMGSARATLALARKAAAMVRIRQSDFGMECEFAD